MQERSRVPVCSPLTVLWLSIDSGPLCTNTLIDEVDFCGAGLQLPRKHLAGGEDEMEAGWTLRKTRTKQWGCPTGDGTQGTGVQSKE